MKSPLRASVLRLSIGGLLLVIAIGIAIFVLPDAERQRLEGDKASAEAEKMLASQKQGLADFQKKDDRITNSRKTLDELFGHMSAESVGVLQWNLSARLYALASKNSIRLQSVKYGATSRESSKGTDLEMLDVEFSATGVYQNMKQFMLDLEDTRESKLPFAIQNARLEESPDGARISVTLRAFRRSDAAPAKRVKETA